MAFKKTFKERFESATLYTALAAPAAGFAGGAWLGATSSLAGGTTGAFLLGAGGAATGLVLGGLVGAAGFVAANAIYKNKEYIALAVVAMAALPFALAARGFDGLRRGLSAKMQKRQTPRANAAAGTSAAPLEKPASASALRGVRALGGRLKTCFQFISKRKSANEADNGQKPATDTAAIPKPSPPPGL